jgi:transposase
LYLFINRRRDRLKILHWHGTGFWVYYKLLEAGTFEMMSGQADCADPDGCRGRAR